MNVPPFWLARFLFRDLEIAVWIFSYMVETFLCSFSTFFFITIFHKFNYSMFSFCLLFFLLVWALSASWTWISVSFLKLVKFSAILSSIYIFPLFPLFLWDSFNMNAIMLDGVVEFPYTVLKFHNSSLSALSFITFYYFLIHLLIPLLLPSLCSLHSVCFEFHLLQFSFLSFFKDLFSLEWKSTQREKVRGREKSKSPTDCEDLHWLDLSTLRWWPETKIKIWTFNQRSHPGAPGFISVFFFNYFIYAVRDSLPFFSQAQWVPLSLLL